MDESFAVLFNIFDLQKESNLDLEFGGLLEYDFIKHYNCVFDLNK